MLELPRRSVTRFFIPLIDVLTLLFCVFLVMPLGEQADGEPDPQTDAQWREERDRHREEIRQLTQELDKIQKDKGLSLQERIAFRVLEIDGTKQGKLFYRDKSAEPHEIRSEADARSLIANDQKALAVNKKELVYVILYPRDRDTDYPTGAQREQYEKWFRPANVRFDKPGDEP